WSEDVGQSEAPSLNVWIECLKRYQQVAGDAVGMLTISFREILSRLMQPNVERSTARVALDRGKGIFWIRFRLDLEGPGARPGRGEALHVSHIREELDAILSKRSVVASEHRMAGDIGQRRVSGEQSLPPSHGAIQDQHGLEPSLRRLHAGGDGRGK